MSNERVGIDHSSLPMSTVPSVFFQVARVLSESDRWVCETAAVRSKAPTNNLACAHVFEILHVRVAVPLELVGSCWLCPRRK